MALWKVLVEITVDAYDVVEAECLGKEAIRDWRRAEEIVAGEVVGEPELIAES